MAKQPSQDDARPSWRGETRRRPENIGPTLGPAPSQAAPRVARGGTRHCSATPQAIRRPDSMNAARPPP
jgi:hypothetical protein